MAQIPSEVDFEKMAERDGVEGFVAGENRDANPFNETGLRAAWWRGWDEAEAIHACG